MTDHKPIIGEFAMFKGESDWLNVLKVWTGTEWKEVKPEAIKPFPEKFELRIMWTVATSSAIESKQKPYEIFARLLYNHLTGNESVTLGKK